MVEIRPDNAQAEYYLTDLIQIAIERGEKINTVPVDPKEALGINSPEQREIAEGLLGERRLVPVEGRIGVV